MFRRIALRAFLIAVLALLGIVPTYGGSPAARAAGTPRVMVVGDSISQGSSGDWTWRYRLFRHLTDSGVAVDMVGPRSDLFNNVTNQQGDMRYADSAFDADHDSTWGRAAYDEKNTIASEVSTAQPDYVLVLLGVNDLAWLTDAPTAEQSLRTLVTNARSAKPDVRLVIGHVLPTERADTDTDFAAKVADLNGRITSIVSSMSTTQSPIALANTTAGFVASTDTYDGTHPNARGEYKIAAAFQDSLSATYGLGPVFSRPLPTVAIGPRTAPVLTTTNGNGQVTISWTESPGATGYWVWTRNVTDGGTWQRLPFPLAMSNSPWVSALLSNGGTYEYKLETTKGHDTGVFSNVATGRPTGPTPGGTALSIASGDGQAKLTWTAVPNATAQYVWTRDVTNGGDWGRLPIGLGGTTWTSAGLRNGGTYEYKLQSYNGYLAGSYSNVVTARPTGPTPAGTSLSVSSGDRKASLSWGSVANATEFYVWTRNVTEGEAWGRLPIPLGGTSWTSTGLRNGGTYEYKLQSMNGYQAGSYSNVVTARPTGPTPGATTLTVTPVNRGAALTWTAVPSATEYYIWVRNLTMQETTFTKLPIPIAGTSWTAGDMVAGASYEFKVQSMNGYIAGGTSSAKPVVPTGVRPAAPTVTVTYAGSTATLDWAAVSNATAYEIYEKNLNDGATTFTKIGMWAPWTSTQYTPYVQWGQTIQYYVVPMNGLLAGTASNVARVRLPSNQYNEIAAWMAGEIRTNAVSDVVNDIKWALSSSCTGNPYGGGLGCLSYAATKWHDLVCTGCVWDHKPIIAQTWDDRDRYFADVPGTGWKIYYDVWSNIHYGYVGRAAGWSRSDLITGSHISEGAGHTDAGDDLSINIGMDLYEQYGATGLTTARLDAAIRSHLADWRSLTGDLQVRAIDNFS